MTDEVSFAISNKGKGLFYDKKDFSVFVVYAVLAGFFISFLGGSRVQIAGPTAAFATIVAGIVAEYNPFHNGHKFHIEQTKKLTGADYIIAIMSGNYVQRGEPAIINKFIRAEMALENGIDLCIELPTCYATASAEYFAYGAVSILHKLNIVDYICFGSEVGDIKELECIANVLNSNDKFYTTNYFEWIQKGIHLARKFNNL